MESALHDFSHRLKRLERQNFRMRVALTFLVASVCIGMFAGMAAQRPGADVIEATEIVLRDVAGVVRCRLAADPVDGAVQILYDSAGNERIRLTADQEGNARLRLYDEEGVIRAGAFCLSSTIAEGASQASLFVKGGGAKEQGPNSGRGSVFVSAQKAGDCNLMLENADPDVKTAVELAVAKGLAYQICYGPNGNRRTATTATPDGNSGHYVFDSAGKTRASMVATQNDEVYQAISGPDEKVRIKSTLAKDGAAITGYLDAGGVQRVVAGTFSNGLATQGVSDSKGVLRAVNATFPDGGASNVVYDKDGKVRIDYSTYKDGQCVHALYDAAGNERVLLATLASGESGYSVMSSDGATKASTTVKRDDSVTHYVEKTAAETAWEVGNVLLNLHQAYQLTK